jgi:hypothetical protein
MKKGYVIIIVIALLAAIWYFFFRKDASNTTAAAVIAPGGALTPAGTSPIMSPNLNATATQASQVLTGPAVVSAGIPASMSPSADVAIDPSQYDAIITNWMNSLGSANKMQALSIEPSMSLTEKAALADIIQNVWTGNRAQTVADTNFWNAWRVKYHVLDGTYSPFQNTNETEQRAYSGVNNFRIKGSPVDAYGG